MREKSFQADLRPAEPSGAPASASNSAAEAAAENDSNYRAVNEELNRVKQKYRAAQYDVDRERKAHAATKAQLARLQNRLDRYERSPIWALSLALVRLSTRLAQFARQFSGAARKQRREALGAIAGSGLFDADWYLSENPDVATAGVDPLVHFYENGWVEGRDPGPMFATWAYLKNNPDVARSGTNPLLHYIEYGRGEGRTIRAPAAAATVPVGTRHNFPQAAPVYRGMLPQEPSTGWRRSYRLSPADPNAFIASNRVIGFIPDRDVRRSIQAAFARLARVSGLGDAHIADGDDDADHGCAAELVDAWHVNKIQLRTRWRAEGAPIVVRAFQHDPTDGTLALIAEGLSTTDLDPVDLSLVDPWFPVLMVFGNADGSLTGTRLLMFPSLCRGGAHYPELLALSPSQPDPLSVGLVLAVELEKARHDPGRLVRSISVGLDGADGTSPLFDPAFRRWLDKVAAVRVGAPKNPQQPAADLIETASAEPDASATLVLPPDTLPTISVLTLAEVVGNPSNAAVYLPIVIAGAEPSQPVTWIEPPLRASAALATGATGYAATWPRLVPVTSVSLPSIPAPCAIRIPSLRTVADAELLTPAMGSALPLVERPAAGVTWLVFANGWRPEYLGQAIQALSVQQGAESHRLVIVGDIDASLLDIAGKLFPERFVILSEADSLAAELTSPFVCYLGTGVILHDNRSAAFLTQLLDDPKITSAACPLVTAERHGKSWHVSIVDAGRIAPLDRFDVPDSRHVAHLLWRTVFTLAEPPGDLWMARSSSVKKWLGSRPPQRLRGGAHVCTTLLTASYVVTPSDAAPEVRVPPAAQESSIKAAVLFG